MTTGPNFPEVFAELTRNGRLSGETVRRVFDAILSGEWTAVQVAGFAVSLRLSGETAELIEAAARSLRDAMLSVDHALPRVLDTCGTGGDASGTLNLSTAAAIVVAAAGVPVAKHGNRAVSSRAGSADVLEALGIPTDLPAGAGATLLDEVGIAFLMAPTHHPAMRHGGVARRELGIRTIFNCLGPLANPARATHQLLGAYDDALRPVLASTLGSLGVVRAWVVTGEDGLDEVSPFGTTRVSVLDGGRVTEARVHPRDFGLEPSAPGAIAGGDAAENARAIASMLAGEPHPAVDALVLNAAAALVVAEQISPLSAAARARETLLSGRAKDLFERWRAAAKRLQSEAHAG
ncbi:MAG: anthranilate phosphoribosyltransferase [Myxococcales bacterium]|nr:anthranilate phosphoribosyltransferase [Myxococcales bacterium]